MDKLQPLIRNHFWILAGLSLPIILYGYYSANSQLKAATAAQVEKLESTKRNVSSGNEANEKYIKKLKFINENLESYVDDSIIDLWKHQQARMTWPSLVAERVPKEFLGEFEQQVPFIYKGAFDEVYRRLMERVQPVRPLDPMTVVNPNTPLGPNQKVVLMANLPQPSFGQFAVSSQEMWDAQIDVWLTEILLDSIVAMNKDKESVRESVIRRLDLLQLMGGSGEPLTADAAAGGDMGGEMGMPGGMGGGRGGQTQKLEGKVGFNPAEEFGPDLDQGAGGGEMGMPSGGMDGVGGAAVPPKRYIGETEEKPYLERGFYMSVIIQQTKIADFIVQLANSDWPVQVRRFQVGVNPYQTFQPMSGDAGGSMMPDFQPSFSSGLGGAGGMDAEGGSGFGGGFNAGVYRSGEKAPPRPNPYSTNLPRVAAEAMNHPDLVRLDLAGVITIYKQPVEILAAVEARKLEKLNAAAPNAVPTGSAAETDSGSDAGAAPVGESMTEPGAPAGELGEPATEPASPEPASPDAAPPAGEESAAPAGGL